MRGVQSAFAFLSCSLYILYLLNKYYVFLFLMAILRCSIIYEVASHLKGDSSQIINVGFWGRELFTFILHSTGDRKLFYTTFISLRRCVFDTTL